MKEEREMNFINTISTMHPFCDYWYLSDNRKLDTYLTSLDFLKENRKKYIFYGIESYQEFTQDFFDYEFNYDVYFRSAYYSKNGNFVRQMSYKNWITSLIKCLYYEMGITIISKFNDGVACYSLSLGDKFYNKYVHTNRFYGMPYSDLKTIKFYECNNQILLFTEIIDVISIRIGEVLNTIIARKNYRCFYFTEKF